MPLLDLRETKRPPFQDMQLLLQILGHFPARNLLVRPKREGAGLWRNSYTRIGE